MSLFVQSGFGFRLLGKLASGFSSLYQVWNLSANSLSGLDLTSFNLLLASFFELFCFVPLANIMSMHPIKDSEQQWISLIFIDSQFLTVLLEEQCHGITSDRAFDFFDIFQLFVC